MPRDNRLPSYESLLEFQEVYLRAVALSWQDPNFKKQLLENPSQALIDWFGFRMEWSDHLVVYDPNAAQDPNKPAYVDSQAQWGWDSGRKEWNLPPIETQLGIPDKPEVKEQLLAFAAYNDAGPTYLFTCC